MRARLHLDAGPLGTVDLEFESNHPRAAHDDGRDEAAILLDRAVTAASRALDLPDGRVSPPDVAVWLSVPADEVRPLVLAALKDRLPGLTASLADAAADDVVRALGGGS